MQLSTWFSFAALLNTLFLVPIAATAQVTGDAPVFGRPSAVINLATNEGVRRIPLEMESEHTIPRIASGLYTRSRFQSSNPNAKSIAVFTRWRVSTETVPIKRFSSDFCTVTR